MTKTKDLKDKGESNLVVPFGGSSDKSVRNTANFATNPVKTDKTVKQKQPQNNVKNAKPKSKP